MCTLSIEACVFINSLLLLFDHWCNNVVIRVTKNIVNDLVDENVLALKRNKQINILNRQLYLVTNEKKI